MANTTSHPSQRFELRAHLMQPGRIQVIDRQQNRIIREALAGGYTKRAPENATVGALSFGPSEKGGDMSKLTESRKSKDEFFAKDQASPLTPRQQQKFQGLEYYPENPQLRIAVVLEEFPEEEKKPTEIITSTGDTTTQIRWGKFSFTVDGQEVSLTVFRDVDEEEFFLPFADSTSGTETYGAGRYLDVVPLHDGSYLIDFNHAYNPYCAYNPNWSCPIPPPGNRLKVAILAGEKLFPDVDGH